MTFDVSSVGLPKWPAMVVRGERVTRQQAAEILVRTDGWHVSTNDREWERLVREVAGLPKSVWDRDSRDSSLESLQKIWNAEEEFKTRHRVLELEYLGNSQIASCYIGGPHGWCDWSGRIGSDSYNIGKWPSAGTVLEEWKRIAEAFPFLRLTCQLFNGETCEEGTVPVVEYVVAEGKASAREPTDRTMTPSDRDAGAMAFAVATGRPGRERGCTIDQLREALVIARATDSGSEGAGDKP